MADVYIKTAEGGETTSPAGTEGIPLDNGVNSTWISINNIAEYIRTLTQTLTNKTLTTPTIANFTNAQHNHSNAAGGGAVSGDWTIVTASVTTANVTGVEGTLHVLDVSGMTANRDYVLPTPSAAGKRCGVLLSTGDATYALLLKINSVEKTRIFITNEVVTFVSTGTGAGDWKVEHDGRIPCKVKLKNTANQNVNNGTSTVLTLDEVDFDNCSGYDTATYRLKPRRTSKYIIIGYMRINGSTAQATKFAVWALDGTNIIGIDERYIAASSYATDNFSTTATLAAGSYLELVAYHNTGATESILGSAVDFPHIEMIEVFE